MRILKKMLIINGIVLGILILILLIVYIAMFTSTNSVMEYAESVFSGETIIENENNPLWRYSLKERYFPETADIKYDLKRIFVMHNFKSGKMYMLYHLQYVDNEGKVIYNSAATSTWYIKKDGGEWIVYDIDEAP